MAKNIIMQVLTSAGYEPMYPFNPAMILNATFLGTSTSQQYNLSITGITVPLTNVVGNNMGIIAFIPTVENESGLTLSINGDTAKPVVYADGTELEGGILTANSFVYLKYQNDKFYLLLGKDQLGLSNVDNTSDLNKPISVAMQNALNNKLNIPQYIPSNSNLNTYQTAGMYYNPANAEVATMSNTPTKLSFSLFVERHSGVKQTLTAYQSSGVQTWVRNFYNGTWGSWVQVGMVYSGISAPSPSLGLDGNLYVKIES